MKKMDNNSRMNIRQALNTHGLVIYRTKGTSMLPLIHEGKDLVKLVPYKDVREPETGDVVLYRRRNGALVLHRIVKVVAHGFIIAGDNCIKGEKVRKRAILARMEGFFSGEKYVSSEDPDYLKYVWQKVDDYGTRTEIIRPQMVVWSQLIKLLQHSILKNGYADIAAEADWKELLNLAKRHSISATVFPAVDPGRCNPEVFKSWETEMLKNIRKCALFDYERSIILSEFEKNKIRYVLLKGLTLADLYPTKNLREFSDNDILIDAENATKAGDIMTRLGYEGSIHSIHDSWKKTPVYNFEIHKRLFIEPNCKFDYFNDVMSRVVPVEGSASTVSKSYEYRLTDDDFYLHIIAHFYKHFSNGGAGLRSFADLWLLNRELSEKKVNINVNLLEEIGLFEFSQKMSELSDRIFTSPETLSYNDISYIMSSGTYGTLTHTIENGIREYGKIGFLINRIFPSFTTMKDLYPLLGKLPVLLPFFWIIRLASRLFSCESRKYFRKMIRIIFKDKQ